MAGVVGRETEEAEGWEADGAALAAGDTTRGAAPLGTAGVAAPDRGAAGLPSGATADLMGIGVAITTGAAGAGDTVGSGAVWAPLAGPETALEALVELATPLVSPAVAGGVAPAGAPGAGTATVAIGSGVDTPLMPPSTELAAFPLPVALETLFCELAFAPEASLAGENA